MQVGAGLLAMLPWAASAGWWLLGGIAFAAGVAWLRAGGGGSEPTTPMRRLFRGGGRFTRVVLFATVFAVYVVPEPAVPFVAAALVVVVAAADVLGVRITAYWRRWVAGVLLVTAAGFVALCLAIAPPVQRATEGVTVGAVVIAVAVSMPMFAGLDRRRILAGAIAALAVSAAALYQLGPFRLGLSPDSLRVVLNAADAAAVQPLLAGVVVLATVPAALLAFTGAREDNQPRPEGGTREPERGTREPERGTRKPGRGTRGLERGTRARLLSALQLVLGAAALAVYLGPEWALVIAALLAILEVATTRPTMW